MSTFQSFTRAGEFWSTAVSYVPSAPKNVLVSGGSAAKVLKHIETPPEHVFIADERMVGETHPDNNGRLIRGLCAPATQVHAWRTEMEVEEALLDYEAGLPEAFDVAFLGVGPDGHIASLFPQHTGVTALISPSGDTAHSLTHTFVVEKRLTLTLQTITRAERIVLLLQGGKKASVWHKLQRPGFLPAHQLLFAHPRVHALWLP